MKILTVFYPRTEALEMAHAVRILQREPANDARFYGTGPHPEIMGIQD